VWLDMAERLDDRVVALELLVDLVIALVPEEDERDQTDGARRVAEATCCCVGGGRSDGPAATLDHC
jgi:hypothetical protein